MLRKINEVKFSKGVTAMNLVSGVSGEEYSLGDLEVAASDVETGSTSVKKTKRKQHWAAPPLGRFACKFRQGPRQSLHHQEVPTSAEI